MTLTCPPLPCQRVARLLLTLVTVNNMRRSGFVQPTQTPSNFLCLDFILCTCGFWLMNEHIHNCSHLPVSTERLHIVTLGLSVQSCSVDWHFQIHIIGWNGNKYAAVQFQMSKCVLVESNDFTVCNLPTITALTASVVRICYIHLKHQQWKYRIVFVLKNLLEKQEPTVSAVPAKACFGYLECSRISRISGDWGLLLWRLARC